MPRKPPSSTRVLSLKPADVSIDDIAFSLAYINRYNGWLGACSVGQHCIYVAMSLPSVYRLHALLHDASEAYLQDMINPVKGRLRICPSNRYMSYRAFEKKVMHVIYEGLGIRFPSTYVQLVVKEADKEAAVFEQRQSVDFFEREENRPCCVIKRFLSIYREARRECLNSVAV